MTRSLGDTLSFLAIGFLLVVQATCVSYGLGCMRDVTTATHAELARVAHASR